MAHDTVILTGASGFIGRTVTRRFAERGFRVHALVRSPERFLELPGIDRGTVNALAWQLGEPAPASVFQETPVTLVHMACATRGAASAVYDLNVSGTERLLESAGGTPLFRVFVSSFNAGPAGDAGLNTRSAYSASKQKVETFFDLSRDLVLRPGLVVGAGEDGLFARMRTQLARGVPMPLFYMGRTPVQWIHVDELADAIVRGVERRTTGLFSVASAEAVSLEAWTEAVAHTLGLGVRSVRIPGVVSDAGAWVLRGAERLGLALPVSSDTVFGIKYSQVVDTRADLERLELSVAGLQQTLERAR